MRSARPSLGRRGLRLAAIAIALSATTANAKLPREVGRAFLDAGIPLNHVGIVVQETTKLRPLFEHDSTRPRNPASVMKLVTTFAALDLLGPDYRWKTEAYLGGPLVDGVLHGDLILKGYGDPKITVEQWQSFIEQLRTKGLAAVDGDLALLVGEKRRCLSADNGGGPGRHIENRRSGAPLYITYRRLRSLPTGVHGTLGDGETDPPGGSRTRNE